MVEVVGEPHPHAALGRSDERLAHDVGGLVAQADVVKREVEALSRLLEERRDGVCDLERRLVAVSQQAKLERAGRRYCDWAFRRAL
jgi:hypothetical protein